MEISIDLRKTDIIFIEKSMSVWPYYPYAPRYQMHEFRYYSPYYDPLLAVRPAVEAEIAASRLRRSRLEAEVARDEAIRRSRVEAEIVASKIATESALRRSRIEA